MSEQSTGMPKDVGEFFIGEDDPLVIYANDPEEPGEPWAIATVNDAISDYDGTGESCRMVARRIVAAVNATAGVPHLRPGSVARLLRAVREYLSSVRAGLKEIQSQGATSVAFRSRAEETAACIDELKAALAEFDGPVREDAPDGQ